MSTTGSSAFLVGGPFDRTVVVFVKGYVGYIGISHVSTVVDDPIEFQKALAFEPACSLCKDGVITERCCAVVVDGESCGRVEEFHGKAEHDFVWDNEEHDSDCPTCRPLKHTFEEVTRPVTLPVTRPSFAT